MDVFLSGLKSFYEFETYDFTRYINLVKYYV